MSHSQIVIHVRDGTVEAVYLDSDCTEVVVVDLGRVHAASDETGSAHVRPVTPRPLRELAGSDIEAAIDAAIEYDVLTEPAWEGVAQIC